MSVEISTSAKYGIDEFRRAIRNAVLDLSDSLTAEKIDISHPHGVNELYNHVTSPGSRNGVVCKTISVCRNSSTTLVVAWTVSSVTIISAIF